MEGREAKLRIVDAVSVESNAGVTRRVCIREGRGALMFFSRLCKVAREGTGGGERRNGSRLANSGKYVL